MNRKLEVTALVLSVITLILSIAALTVALNKAPADKDKETTKDVQYVMYLGTNDKDTNEPVLKPEEAKKRAEQILLDHFGGYTIQEANGGWKGDDKVYTEYTLVIYLSDTDIDAVHAAAKEMIQEFNQSSVLIQANETTTEFYEG